MGQHQATITAKYGAGGSAASLVLTGVNIIDFNMDRKLLTVVQGSNPPREFDIGGVTTVTITIAGNNYTVAIS